MNRSEVRLMWDRGQGGYVAPDREAKPRRHRPFLRGPISLVWLHACAALPGKALHAALCLRYLQGLTNHDTVSPGRSHYRAFGLTRPSWYQALTRLEKAGLVRTQRIAGRKISITIIEQD